MNSSRQKRRLASNCVQKKPHTGGGKLSTSDFRSLGRRWWHAGASHEICMAMLCLAGQTLQFSVALAVATIMQAIQATVDEITDASATLPRDLLPLCHAPSTPVRVAHGRESALIGSLRKLCIPSGILCAKACSTCRLHQGSGISCRNQCGICPHAVAPQLLQRERAI